MDMYKHKLHGMARACYNAADEKVKKSAKELFNKVDKNGDGTVSVKEFVLYAYKLFGNEKCNKAMKMFQVLDADDNSCLDFWEAVTFYYITQNNWAGCDGCGTLLFDAHFICSTCFGEKKTYNLCVDCYSTSSSKHMNHDNCDGPANFVSNNHLLRTVLQVQDSAITWEKEGSEDLSVSRKLLKARVAMEIVSAAGDVGDLNSCSIM